MRLCTVKAGLKKDVIHRKRAGGSSVNEQAGLSKAIYLERTGIQQAQTEIKVGGAGALYTRWSFRAKHAWVMLRCTH